MENSGWIYGALNDSIKREHVDDQEKMRAIDIVCVCEGIVSWLSKRRMWALLHRVSIHDLKP